jgi:hypothetical protein
VKSFKQYITQTTLLAEGAASHARTYMSGFVTNKLTQQKSWEYEDQTGKRPEDTPTGVTTRVTVRPSVSTTTLGRLRLPVTPSVPGELVSKIQKNQDVGGEFSQFDTPAPNPDQTVPVYGSVLNTRTHQGQETTGHEVRHAIQHAGLGINRGLLSYSGSGAVQTPTDFNVPSRLADYRQDPSAANMQRLVAGMDLTWRRRDQGEIQRREHNTGRGGAHVPMVPGEPTDKAYTEFMSAITGVPPVGQYNNPHHQQLTGLLTVHDNDQDTISGFPHYSIQPSEVDARVQDHIHHLLSFQHSPDLHHFISAQISEDPTIQHHLHQFHRTGNTEHLDRIRQHTRNLTLEITANFGDHSSQLTDWHNRGTQYLDKLEDKIKTGDMYKDVVEYGKASAPEYTQTREWQANTSDAQVWKKNALKAMAIFRTKREDTLKAAKQHAQGAAGLILDNNPHVDGFVADMVGETPHGAKVQSWVDSRRQAYDPEFNFAAQAKAAGYRLGS